MLTKLTHFFIPKDFHDEIVVVRQYKLVLYIILLTALFDLNYAGITIMIGLKEGTTIMLITSLIHLLLPFLIKKNVSLKVVSNLYIFFGVFAVVVCIYYSGGFSSPVLPWLTTSPIVALLMAGKRSGFFWMAANCIIILILGVLSHYDFDFPSKYNPEWANYFFINCYVGLVIITFIVTLVFETGKNLALKKLAEKNVLLAEEKKKVALQQISQEIHDNIGQTLSLAKLNLHSLERRDRHSPNDKLNETLKLVAKAIQDLRALSNDLYADNLTDFNIIDAVENELDTISRIGDYTTELTVSGEKYELSPQTEFILYRICQELINNVIKHSGSNSIKVIILYEPNQFSLSVTDNGCGIKCEEYLRKGQGIRNIRNRAKLLGGCVDINTKRNEGTTVNIQLPTMIHMK